MFIAFRYLRRIFRIDHKRIPLRITIFCIGVRPERVPAAQPVNPQDLLPYFLCDPALQLFPIDREVSQESLFDIGVGRFCGRPDGKAGQHQCGHNQQERKQRKSLSLLPYGIEESPFTQIHCFCHLISYVVLLSMCK